MIPQGTAIEGKTFLDKPEGLLITPPGLSLSNLIEQRLGYSLKNCGLDVLVRTLPKVLVEDLEAVRDVEIEVKGEFVKIRLVDSIYADFCQEVRQISRRCALGCPMCSALACILALASGKPVLFEDEKSSRDKRTTESPTDYSVKRGFRGTGRVRNMHAKFYQCLFVHYYRRS